MDSVSFCFLMVLRRGRLGEERQGLSSRHSYVVNFDGTRIAGWLFTFHASSLHFLSLVLGFSFPVFHAGLLLLLMFTLAGLPRLFRVRKFNLSLTLPLSMSPRSQYIPPSVWTVAPRSQLVIQRQVGFSGRSRSRCDIFLVIGRNSAFPKIRAPVYIRPPKHTV